MEFELFKPKSEESPHPQNGERCQGPGMWFEAIFPVFKDGCRHHVTQTWLNSDGKVIKAYSNMCRGITFAPNHMREDGWVAWDDVSHFEDHAGNIYQKVEDGS